MYKASLGIKSKRVDKNKMAYKKISDLLAATEISQQDLFLLSDMLGLTSRKVSFQLLADSLNTTDINGRLQEGNSYEINRDIDGLVTSVTTQIQDFTKTFTFNRDASGVVSSVNIHNSNDSYSKTYTFVRDENGFVTSITIS